MRVGQAWKNVQSKEDLVLYIRALADDLENNAGSWENPKLEQYLDSLARWLGSIDAVFENMGEEPPTEPTWGLMALMLYAAKIYA